MHYILDFLEKYHFTPMKQDLKFYLIMLSLIFLLDLSISNATPFNCTGTGISSISGTVQPYLGVGESDYVYATYLDVNNVPINEGYSSNQTITNTSVRFLYNTSYINMTYDSANSRWKSLVTGTSDENITFKFEGWSQNYTCANTSNYILKIRVPYYLTFQFYKTSINQGNFSLMTDPYINDFQYVVLQFSSYIPQAFRTTNYLNNFGNMFWFYKPIEVADDTTLSFWASYTDGQAVVKLYDLGDYSINLLSVQSIGQAWSNEFTYPQYTSQRYISTLNNKLTISNVSNVTLKGIVSKWEINKYEAISNLIYWVIAIIIYAILMYFVLAFGGIAGWRIAIVATIAFFLIAKVLNMVII